MTWGHTSREGRQDGRGKILYAIQDAHVTKSVLLQIADADTGATLMSALAR